MPLTKLQQKKIHITYKKKYTTIHKTCPKIISIVTLINCTQIVKLISADFKIEFGCFAMFQSFVQRIPERRSTILLIAQSENKHSRYIYRTQ